MHLLQMQIFLLDMEGGSRAQASGHKWHEDLQWSRRLDEAWDLSKVKQVSQQAVWQCSTTEEPLHFGISYCCWSVRWSSMSYSQVVGIFQRVSPEIKHMSICNTTFGKVNSAAETLAHKLRLHWCTNKFQVVVCEGQVVVLTTALKVQFGHRHADMVWY